MIKQLFRKLWSTVMKETFFCHKIHGFQEHYFVPNKLIYTGRDILSFTGLSYTIQD